MKLLNEEESRIFNNIHKELWTPKMMWGKGYNIRTIDNLIRYGAVKTVRLKFPENVTDEMVDKGFTVTLIPYYPSNMPSGERKSHGNARPDFLRKIRPPLTIEEKYEALKKEYAKLKATKEQTALDLKDK